MNSRRKQRWFEEVAESSFQDSSTRRSSRLSLIPFLRKRKSGIENESMMDKSMADSSFLKDDVESEVEIPLKKSRRFLSFSSPLSRRSSNRLSCSSVQIPSKSVNTLRSIDEVNSNVEVKEPNRRLSDVRKHLSQINRTLSLGRFKHKSKNDHRHGDCVLPTSKDPKDCENDKRFPLYSNASNFDEQYLKKREQMQIFSSTVKIVEENFEDVISSCDAVVCEISIKGLPLSILSKNAIEKMDEEMKSDLLSQLKFQRKIVIQQFNFLIYKFVIFVTVSEMEVNSRKTAQNLRFIYCNIIDNVIQHDHITSIHIPYLFINLDQDLVATTALTSIQWIFLQKGFKKLKQIYIGGNDTTDCYLNVSYTNELQKLVSSMVLNLGTPFVHSQYVVRNMQVDPNLEAEFDTDLEDSHYFNQSTASVSFKNIHHEHKKKRKSGISKRGKKNI